MNPGPDGVLATLTKGGKNGLVVVITSGEK